MTKTINNSEDVIDSREIIDRIDELEYERNALIGCITIKNWDEYEGGEELKALKALASEAEEVEDWHHGVTLIRETYFTEYCQKLCSDIGDLPKDIPAYLVIDWEATARNLKVDYTEVEYGGQTYLVR